MVRVLLIAQLRLCREALETALGLHGRLDVLCTANGFSGDVIAVARQYQPQVVLVQGVSPAGYATTRAVAATVPHAAVVVLGAVSEVDVVRWVEAGVTGFVDADASALEIAAAVLAAAGGELVAPPSVIDAVFRHIARRPVGQMPARTSLSLREVEIARLLAAGHSNKEIAGSLFIEVATVKNHVHSILEKLGVARRGDVSVEMLKAPDRAIPVGELARAS